jgi:hypothetical protein
MPATPARGEAQCPTRRPALPLMCSAALVGMMIASEVRRAYLDYSGPPCNRRFWDRPQHRRTCCPAKRTSAGVRPRPSRTGAMADTLARLENILWRTCEQIGEDRLLAVAAGVVF